MAQNHLQATNQDDPFILCRPWRFRGRRTFQYSYTQEESCNPRNAIILITLTKPQKWKTALLHSIAVAYNLDIVHVLHIQWIRSCFEKPPWQRRTPQTCYTRGLFLSVCPSIQVARLIEIPLRWWNKYECFSSILKSSLHLPLGECFTPSTLRRESG